MRLLACLDASFLLEVKEARQDVMTFAETYAFVIRNDWWGIIKLPLCFGIDKTLTVHDVYFLYNTLDSYIYCMFSSNLC